MNIAITIIAHGPDKLATQKHLLPRNTVEQLIEALTKEGIVVDDILVEDDPE